MPEEIEYEQFDVTEPAATSAGDVDLTRISDIPMELSVEIGRTEMTVGETLALGVGMIVALDRVAGEPVNLLANGTPIARGEVIVIDDRLGMRVTEIIETENAHFGVPEGAAEPPLSGEDAVATPLATEVPSTDGHAGEPVAA